ncbi:MAG: hypothetical protein JST00_43370 [Deltaproteobacteria bacterium]|nr:hypothetical protein [Deltaproteobacteria bacterium]
MMLRRLALLLVVGATVLACEFKGWDRDPDRCKRYGLPYVCEGNAVATYRQVCVNDDHLESIKEQVSACPEGTFCSYAEGLAKCLPPPRDDAGSDAEVDAAASDAAADDAAVDGGADDGGADDASSGDAAES